MLKLSTVTAGMIVAIANVASATEITLDLGSGHQPDYGTGGEDYLHSVSWYTGLVDVEMHTQGNRNFGFIDIPSDVDDEAPDFQLRPTSSGWVNAATTTPALRSW